VETSEHVAGTSQTALDLLKLAYPTASFGTEKTVGLEAPSEIDEVFFTSGVWLDITSGGPTAVKGVLAQVNEMIGEPGDKKTRPELLVFTADADGKQKLRARLVLDDWLYFDDFLKGTAATGKRPSAIRLAPGAAAIRLDRHATASSQDWADWMDEVRFYVLDHDGLRMVWQGVKEEGGVESPDGRDRVRTSKWSIKVTKELSNGLFDLEVTKRGGQSFEPRLQRFTFDGKSYLAR
jgi:hypothetical protein